MTCLSGPPRDICNKLRLRASTYPGGASRVVATARHVSPSLRYRVANLAAQRRVAFSSIALKTALRSPGELLMISSTSAVAVSRSRASSSSLVSSSSLSCKFAGDACLIGALRALGLVVRRPLGGRLLSPRRCMSPPRLGHDELNPTQILAFAPWQDVRFGSKADICGATRDVR